jgi:hypothetical protein
MKQYELGGGTEAVPGMVFHCIDQNGLAVGMPPADFLTAVGLGLIPGYARMAALGNNPNLTSGTVLTSPQDVWPGGGVYPFLAAASLLEVVSADADDAAAGTGARTISIAALDANYVSVTVTATLNGVTPVALGTVPLLRINSVRVTSAGSTGTNEGILTVRVAGGGATVTLVPARYGWARQTVFTVPAGFSLSILNQYFGIVSPSSTKDCDMAIVQRAPNGSYVMALEVSLDGNPFILPADPGLLIPEKFDVFHRCNRASATMTVNTAMLGVLRDNRVA